MTPKEVGFYPRVSLGFANRIDTQVVAFARNVIAMMTGNESYKTPLPTLEAVTTAADAFEVAIHEAMDGGKVAIATRNAARAELLSLLRQLASYVSNNCGADLVKLVSSGFPGCQDAIASGDTTSAGKPACGIHRQERRVDAEVGPRA